MSSSDSPIRGPVPCDLLVSGALILPVSSPPISDGAIAVSKDRIVAVGASPEIEKTYAPARRLSGRGRIVLPGLVNTHNHTPLMITRGMVEDLGFAPAYTPGIPQGHWLSDEETYLLSRLGAWELLRFGSTTVVDYYRRPEACARALSESGLRAFVGGRIHDADSAALSESAWRFDPKIGAETLRESQDLIERWDGKADGRIRCFHAPHAPDTCSAGLLREVAALAAADGRQVHTHLAQSPMEVARVEAREGIRPPALLEKVGLLNDRLVAAHCLFLDEAEIETVGRAGVRVAHSAVGNLTSGTIAPIVKLAAAGAMITLCTDTMTGDMFQTMRTAIAAARVRGAGFDLNAATVLGWATRGGAAALGMAGEIGELSVGAKADFILLDADAPNMRPIVDGIGIVVHSANGTNVTAAVIDGRVVMEDGRPTLFDAEEVIRAAQQAANRLWTRAGRPPVLGQMWN